MLNFSKACRVVFAEEWIRPVLKRERGVMLHWFYTPDRFVQSPFVLFCSASVPHGVSRNASKCVSVIKTHMIRERRTVS